MELMEHAYGSTMISQVTPIILVQDQLLLKVNHILILDTIQPVIEALLV